MTWANLVAALRPSVRAGLTAGLAVGIARLLRLPYPLYAMIAVVIVTDLSATRTRELALRRLAGTVLGATLGALIHPWLPPAAWSLGLGVLAAMLLSYLLRMHDAAAKVAGYVCGIVLLEHGDHPWSYALYRAVETILGIGLAVLVSLVPPLIPIDERSLHGQGPSRSWRSSRWLGPRAGKGRRTVQTLFEFLRDNPFLLLFVTLALSVWIGRFSVKGYGLGMVAAAVVVGVALATWASTYGVKLQLDNFAKSLMYYLFMYGVGLRVGPSFFNSLKKDGVTFTILAVICSVLGLGLVVVLSRMFGLPPGAAGGVLAGSQTMSAAIGTAEMAITQGAYQIPAGSTAEAVTAMIALGYGITYIWGTVGIILICKYLPKWWGVDARQAAREYEAKEGVPNLDDAGLTGYRPAGLRAYRLENPQAAGKSITAFRREHPEYRVLNVVRGGTALGADPGIVFEKGDVIALGGRLESLTDKMGLIGPEVADPKALNIPLDQAEILVSEKEMEGKALKEFRHEDFAGQLQVLKLERGGVPIPVGADTTLKRFDVLFVAGLRDAVDKVAARLGRVARPSTATDLLTLSIGMIVGLLIGGINVPVGSFKVGLGNAGGLLLSGILVSSVVSRLRFFGSTPNAARNILEDLGLVTFVGIVGINAGASLLAQLTGAVAAKIFLVGFLASTIPPFVTWALGYHLFKINPAVLMGGVAGARSHSGPAREAAKEIGSSVPWVGFPVGYAVSGVLLTVFGYFAMVLSQ